MQLGKLTIFSRDTEESDLTFRESEYLSLSEKYYIGVKVSNISITRIERVSKPPLGLWKNRCSPNSQILKIFRLAALTGAPCSIP